MGQAEANLDHSYEASPLDGGKTPILPSLLKKLDP
jgi:hypothetical protein